MPEIQAPEQAFEAPHLSGPKVLEDPWVRDQQAFFFMLPELLKTFRGKYVAVHDGKVVEVGDTIRSVLLRAREHFPKTEVYIQLVDEKFPIVKMRSPRKGLL